MVEELRAIDVKIPEEDAIMILLNSSPDDFQQVKVALKTHKDLTFERVATRLREAERELSAATKSTEEESAYAARRQRHFNNKKKICYVCKKPGHVSTECRNNPDAKMKCHNCSKIGHRASNCKARRKEAGTFNNALVATIEKGESALTSRTEKTVTKDWIIDSGASQHMCKEKSMFSELNPLESPIQIRLGDNRKVEATHEGKIRLRTKNEGKSTLNDVLYAPGLSQNLLSVSSCIKHGNRILFHKNGVRIYNGEGRTIGLGKLKNDGLYYLNNDVLTEKVYFARSENQHLWHSRFGHLGFNNLQQLQKKDLVKGLEEANLNSIECEICASGKQVKLDENHSFW